MSGFSTPAILIRRIDYGDYDLVVTLFTLKKGKISAIAKSAKKSRKRFAGVLELFSSMDVVCQIGRRKGMPVLQEAILNQPFPNIRRSIRKTAYAGYWSEMINTWLEEKEAQTQLYQLFGDTLTVLDKGDMPEEALSVLFQMRFMKLAGLRPNLTYCRICQNSLERITGKRVGFDLVKGGIVCGKCSDSKQPLVRLSRGTVKQLEWIESGDMARAKRLRLSSQAIFEGEAFLEAFVPTQLGTKMRSLTVLRRIREP